MSARKLQLLLAIAAVATLSYGVTTLARKVEKRGALWDVDYYRIAVERYEAGTDPYLEAGLPTGYLYSPSLLVPMVAAVRALDSGHLYVGLMILAVAASLALAIAAFDWRSAPLALCVLYALALGNGQAVYLVASGNLAWAVGLLLGGALLAASRGRWRLFYLLVGIATLIKPYSLAFLVLPFVVRALSPWLVLAVLPTALDRLLAMTLWRGLDESWLEAIGMTVADRMLRYSFAGGVSRLLVWGGDIDAPVAIAVGLGAQVVVCVALALLLWARRPSDRRQALALATVVALCALPRVSSYDAYLFGPAVFLAFWPRSPRLDLDVRSGLRILLLIAALFKEGLVHLPVLTLVWFIAEATRRPSSGCDGEPAAPVPPGADPAQPGRVARVGP